MRANRRVSLGLSLTLLAAAAVVLIPTVASGRSDAGGAKPAAAHVMGGHVMAGDEDALQDELAQVRRVTARFHDVDAAREAGYELGWVNGAGVRIITGCVASPAAGAMGYHYFNAGLMADLTTDALAPEVLVYAPGENGRLELAAVEWIVRGPNSNPPGVAQAPSMLGMPMHILVPAV